MKKTVVLRVCLLLALILPIAMAFGHICVGGGTVPYYDEWSIVRYYKNSVENGIDFHQLLKWQDNDHRNVVPVIVQMLIWSVTKCNDKVVTLVSFAVLLTAFGVIAAYWRKNGLPLMLLLPAAALCFFLKQGMMFLWPSCNLWQLLIFFAVLSFFAYSKYLRRGKAIDLFAALLCGALCTFCAANGLLIWVAYCLLFLEQRIFEEKKLITKGNVTVAATGAVCWALYFHDWFSRKDLFVRNLEDFVQSFLMQFATPFFGEAENTQACIPGAVILACFLVGLWFVCSKKKVSQSVFPFLLAIFFFGSMMLVSFGRAGLRPLRTLQSQYTQMPVWFLASALLLAGEVCFNSLNRPEQRTALSAAGAGLYIVLLCCSVCQTYVIELYEKNMQAAAYTVQHYESAPEKMKTVRVYPWLTIDDLVAWMKENRLFVFADDKDYIYPYNDYVVTELDEDFEFPQNRIDVGTHIVDFVNGERLAAETEVTQSETLSIDLWAADSANLKSPSAAYIELGGKYFRLQQYERPDVVKHLQIPTYQYCGFKGDIPTDGLGAGSYPMQLIVLTDGKESYYTSVLTTVNVLARQPDAEENQPQ